MYKRILIPLDGSKLAEGVLPHAKFLARSLQLRVELMHINDPETAAPSAYAIPGSDYLKEVAATFPASLTVNCCIENGRAAEVIVDTASRDTSTLITRRPMDVPVLSAGYSEVWHKKCCRPRSILCCSFARTNKLVPTGETPVAIKYPIVGSV